MVPLPRRCALCCNHRAYPAILPGRGTAGRSRSKALKINHLGAFRVMVISATIRSALPDCSSGMRLAGLVATSSSDAERFCQRFGEVHVVADDFMCFQVYRAERRVGVEGGDFDHAGGLISAS